MTQIQQGKLDILPTKGLGANDDRFVRTLMSRLGSCMFRAYCDSTSYEKIGISTTPDGTVRVHPNTNDAYSFYVLFSATDEVVLESMLHHSTGGEMTNDTVMWNAWRMIHPSLFLQMIDENVPSLSGMPEEWVEAALGLDQGIFDESDTYLIDRVLQFTNLTSAQRGPQLYIQVAAGSMFISDQPFIFDSQKTI